MRSSINQMLASNVAVLSKGKSIGGLRQEMKAAGFDIGQGTLQRILAGETGIRMESLQKVADYFSVDLDTLLRGHLNDEQEFTAVSRLSVSGDAIPGRTNGVVEMVSSLQFRRDFLRAVGVSPANAAVVTMAGTSMEPTIRDGAILLLNRAEKEPHNGSIYAFSWAGEMLVKRFQKVNDRWRAVSDNADKEEHPDIVMEAQPDGLIQGRAIWMGARL
ncbi:hypothetical protein DJFAAGMI_01296 [Comamonas sp. PE63]|uniref:HTH cro/C1-type domain-containing protein n=2 Tax=Comamonas brasiliensis TaxID=1812482 RepID=A0ABS5LQD0_9BURK|nr:hypothetical protein [Comamonas sp. PE63]